MKAMRITYFSATATELPSVSHGASLFRKDCDLTVTARSRSQLFDDARVAAFVADAMRSDAVIVTLHGGKASCPAFEPLIEAVNGRRASGEKVPRLHVQPLGGDEEALLAAREHSDGMEDGSWRSVFQYLAYGGAANVRGALARLHAIVHGTGAETLPPEPVAQEGVHHPDLPGIMNVEDYARKWIDPGKPTIGVWFYQSYRLNGNVAHIDALVREIEGRGANVLPVFSMRLRDEALGNRGSDEIIRSYFMKDGKPRIDALINTMSMSMTITNRDFLGLYPELGVAVVQALTSSNPYAVWKESDQGLATMDVTFQAAQPEFDGALITVPVATREEDEIDPITGALIMRYAPIPERVRAVVSLALKWAELRRKPNSEKRIAIVFHHYPPRNDRIGCAAGLDSFASVKRLLDRMSEEGYRVDRLFADGDELANSLLERMTCDRRWLSPDQLAERSEASAGRDVFLPWHEALPSTIRKKMTGDWGAMPGDLFVHNDALHFAGMRDGNVFLTIQPPRGYLENPEKVLHDMRLSPPHHYLAHYRWLRDVFRADAVMHVGKHGSLEWLPGKALGLGEECYPDLSIMDLPNVYPYIINDPSEGTQAKRRSYCCIIDHLTPAYTNADLYEDLAEVERAAANYTEAARQDPGKLPVLAGLLWDAVEKADLHHDLSLSKEAALADMEGFMAKLHGHLSELGDTMIGDGLHTMGQTPEGERLVQFMVQLTRLPNGDEPSLREEILASMGHGYGKLVEHRGEPIPGAGGATGGQIIAKAQEKAVELVRALAAADYDPEAARDVASAHCGGAHPRIARALRYIAETLVPNVRRVTDEIDASLAAFSGSFVAPGPSGAPTRGQADILPTGRNFFSLDPRAIPSPGAWEVGKALANALIERCRQEEGRLPENVGIIVWGGSTMRSRGDDIAEILYLMGVRPIWQASGIVSGLEIIPLAELGRPRIDVVPRISGFFRDAFPNLVEMMDKAARMVAVLEEDPASNFLRRHVLTDLEEYRRGGMDEKDAWRMATLRVFGCPPGTYGAGVAELVESKNWETKDDLGESYIRWTAHAYGQGTYGAKRPEAFRRVLARMDVTVKNEDSREYDMMSCTDFYNYYGGLIAAVHTVRGVAPLSLSGDSSDPRRVLVRTTQEEAKHILRSRLLNPKWLEGLKRHGYKGAGDISKVMDIIIGWDATADVMEDWMYERVASKYALDPEMRDWLKKVNPYALQNILDKLLETIHRGMWSASDAMQNELRDAYLEIEGEIEEVSESARAQL
mgnify:CR=1 FL=1